MAGASRRGTTEATSRLSPAQLGEEEDLYEVLAQGLAHPLLGEFPTELALWLLPVHWDVDKLWGLTGLAEAELVVEELAWALALPWWRDERADGRPWFKVRPAEVLAAPALWPEQYERVLRADLSFPVHVVRRHGRWALVDGVHRLAKAWAIGQQSLAGLVLQASDVGRILYKPT
jgi:hypothetical protein